MGDDRIERLAEWEAERRPLDARVVANRLFHIVYFGRNEDDTGRIIKTTGVSVVRDDVYLEAFCFLRGAQRTFNVDRINQVTELLTGRILTDHDFIDWLEQSVPELDGWF